MFAMSMWTGWFPVEIRVPDVVSDVPVSWHAPHDTVPLHAGDVAEPPHPAFNDAFPPWQFNPAHTPVPPTPGAVPVPAFAPAYVGAPGFHVLSNRMFTFA